MFGLDETLARLVSVEGLATLAALLVGLTVHEYAHARVAFALGDPTAYLQGRLTLDPRKHLDPLGALMFILVHVGWARPVPIDPYRLGRAGTLKVSLAGPLSNVLLAAAAALPLRIGVLSIGGAAMSPAVEFLWYFAVFNILLAVFNMLPIPPLDGWKVFLGVVPERWAQRLGGLEQYGFVVLLGVFAVGMLGVPLLWTVMSPFITVLSWLLIGPLPTL